MNRPRSPLALALAALGLLGLAAPAPGCADATGASPAPAGSSEHEPEHESPVPAGNSAKPAPSPSPGASAEPSPSAPSPSASSPSAGPAREPGGAGLACPEGEVFIPATGPDGFTMGRGYRGETDKAHKVVLTRPFCMDSTEVTVRDYQKCVESGACKLPYGADIFATYPRFPEHPVNMVSWDKARSFCSWAGKRLPTEAEWEWAAGGKEGPRYPWGDGPEPTCGVGLADFTPFGAPKSNPGGDVGCFGGGPSAVKAHPKGVKHWPGGDLYDLGGNVWEWCEDSYAPYTTEDQVDPLVRQETNNHAIRGGGWNRPARALQTAFRGSAIHTYQVPGLGFRCVRGEPHPTPPPRQKKSN